MVDNSWSPQQIKLPDWPVTGLLKLTNLEATWLVGGTVRDLLLNRPLHDWDFVTREDGIKLAKKAANYYDGAFYVLDQSRATGRAVVYPPGSQSPITLDFATMRAKDLRGDLEIRDFTINSMAMSLSGHLIDPLNCAGDLIRKTIRMTTPACFIQDPVRLLRAIRQANFLHYGIETETQAAIYKQAHLISTISSERVHAELCALLSYPITAPSVQELQKSQLLQIIIPELILTDVQHSSEIQGQYTSWDRILRTLKAADLVLGYIQSNQPDVFIPVNFDDILGWHSITKVLRPYIVRLRHNFADEVNVGINYTTILRWATLMQNIPFKKVQHRLTALRMPKKSISTICRLIQSCTAILPLKSEISRKAIYRFNKQAEQTGLGAVIFALAYIAAEPPQSDVDQSFVIHNAGLLLHALFEESESLSPTPFLRGDALLDLGVPPGPEVGLMLDRLVEAQVTGEITSRSYAVNFVKKSLTDNGMKHK